MKRQVCLIALAFLFASCAQIVSVRQTHPHLSTVSSWPSSGLTSPDLGDYLTIAREAARMLHRNAEDSQARTRYNFAVARCVEFIEKAKIVPWAHPVSVSSRGGQYLLTAKVNERNEQHPGDYELIPSDTLIIGGSYFHTLAKVNGLGAPLVAITRDESNNYRETFNVRRIYAAFTAILRFSDRTAELELIQPLQTEQIDFEGHTFRVAADFSAPLALDMARERPQRLGFIRVFFPDRYQTTERLARLQPYDQSRTPVLFVHGLQDTSATWAPMICTLLNDVQVRRHYQLWTFSYPSGYPFPYSASILRNDLNGLSNAFPNHKRIVLVGHSLGGLVVRLMATDSGDRFWRAAFGTSPDETRAVGSSARLAQESLIFRHRDDVQRVVFISTPHRGSELASGFIGRMAARLITAPQFVIAFRDAILAVASQDRAAILLRSVPNSITTLSPKNWFIKELNNRPITAPYHSIIGDRGRGDTPNSSDGIVPYWSSHLDGARSERIVPSDHRAQLNPEGIAEVKRILESYK